MVVCCIVSDIDGAMGPRIKFNNLPMGPERISNMKSFALRI